MKQTSKKLQITLAIALMLTIAANIAGTIYAQDEPQPVELVSVSR